MSKASAERLRFGRTSTGAMVIEECPTDKKSETAQAKKVAELYCPRCVTRIAREPFHQINGVYIHAACAKTF